jgi:hypothetical protein
MHEQPLHQSLNDYEAVIDVFNQFQLGTYRNLNLN